MFKEAASWVKNQIIKGKQLEQHFFTAVITGDLDLMRELLKEGVNINAIDHHGQTAMHIVAEKGDLRVGRYLFEKRIDINKHTGIRHGDSPLITAIIFNRIQFASFLLHHGADPNVRNIFGRTALLFAVMKKSPILVKTLLYFKARPNVVDEYGNTPLSWSMIEYPSRVIADVLIRWGADPDFRGTKSQPLLLELALNTRSTTHLKMVKLLTEHKLNINIQHPISQQTALHMVSITGYVPLARLLLKHGASTILRDITGRTAYEVAVEHNQTALILMYKDREKMLKEILRNIQFPEDKSESSATIVRKKRDDPRTVRFSEIETKESEEELFLKHLL